MRKISFFIVLSVSFLVITSILLLIWWPVKATLAEITNSWVSLIMIYLILVVFLYEKPLYKFYNEFMNIKGSGRHDPKQLKQKEILDSIIDYNYSELVSYRNPEWDNILERERQEDVNSAIFRDEVTKYVRKLQEKNIKWCFLYADTYLALQAKYILFWFYKFKTVSRENFCDIWQDKISDSNERDAILNALLDLEFIREEEDGLFITELGLTYVNYLKELDKEIDNHEETIISAKNQSE